MSWVRGYDNKEGGTMKVLVACEFSGIVRDAFIEQGHEAVSCDLEPSERPGPHIQGDVRAHLNHSWDLMIAHPPCTHTAVSGARWFKDKKKEQQEAINFFLTLYLAPAKRICIEHPVSIISTVFRKPDQYIQPWQFGHPESKKTGLWLRNLPLLEHTEEVYPWYESVHREPPGPDRQRNRSRFYTGIAKAMAEQWGNLE
jgi:hypothetical protein